MEPDDPEAQPFWMDACEECPAYLPLRREHWGNCLFQPECKVMGSLTCAVRRFEARDYLKIFSAVRKHLTEGALP